MTNLFKTFVFIYLVCTSGEAKPSTNILKEMVAGDAYATDMPSSQINEGNRQSEAVSSLAYTDHQDGLQPVSDTVASMTKGSSDRKGKFLELIHEAIAVGYFAVLDVLGIIKLKDASKIIDTHPKDQEINQTTPQPKGPVPVK